MINTSVQDIASNPKLLRRDRQLVCTESLDAKLRIFVRKSESRFLLEKG
jgi:hypothetical protein